MVVNTLELCWEILRHYFENHGNVAECVREAPSALYVRYLVKKVIESGILIDKPKREKPKTVHTTENIAAMAESVCVKRDQHQFTVVLNN